MPVAVILNDKELVRLLTHLGLPAEFPVFPASAPAKQPGGSAFGGKPAPRASQTCGPPDYDCQLDPRADLYEAIESASSDD